MRGFLHHSLCPSKPCKNISQMTLISFFYFEKLVLLLLTRWHWCTLRTSISLSSPCKCAEILFCGRREGEKLVQNFCWVFPHTQTKWHHYEAWWCKDTLNLMALYVCFNSIVGIILVGYVPRCLRSAQRQRQNICLLKHTHTKLLSTWELVSFSAETGSQLTDSSQHLERSLSY